jgi:hypothetical protein
MPSVIKSGLVVSRDTETEGSATSPPLIHPEGPLRGCGNLNAFAQLGQDPPQAGQYSGSHALANL